MLCNRLFNNNQKCVINFLLKNITVLLNEKETQLKIDFWRQRFNKLNNLNETCFMDKNVVDCQE